MLTYTKLKKEPSKFLALTSLTTEEFDDLLPTFKMSWEADVKKRIQAKPRKRKAGGGRKPTLKSLEDMCYSSWSTSKYIRYKKSRVLCLV